METAASRTAPQVPVVAVCGWSGSGKTTLLEEAIPRLRDDGLAVAVVKHDAHGVDVDRVGKDSDRLFRAGADVVLTAPDQALVRRHVGPARGLDATLAALAPDHDLVLVEGHKGTALPKLWLASGRDPTVPSGTAGVLRVLPWDRGRLEPFLSVVGAAVREHFAARRVSGGVLIGGASARMGRPKQLLELAGRPFAEHVRAALAPHVREVALLGGGKAPWPLTALPRLPDPPGVAGPLAALLAALRWAPASAWLLAACDLPRLTSEAVAWLASQRRPGCWAVLPLDRSGRAQPLAAAYEPQALALLEQLAAAGTWAPHRLVEHPKIATPAVPAPLADAWRGVDTPEDLARL